MIFDEMWRKQRSRDKLAKSYDKDTSKLVKAKDFRAAESLSEEAAHFVTEADDELAFIRSSELVKKARRLPVPLPDYADKQAWDDSWDRRVLTAKGYDDLRSKIRQEEKERLQHRMRLWREVLIPIGTFILGVVGTYMAMRRQH